MDTKVAPSPTNSFLKTTSSFGNYVGYFRIVTSIIIGLVLLGIGIYILFRKNELANYTPINATVTSAKCSNINRNYSCSLTVSYIVNNITYHTPLSTNSTTNYNINNIITILYSNSNPNIIVIKPYISNNAEGYIFGIIGIIFLICSYFTYKFNKNSTFRQFETLSFFANLFIR